MEVWSALGFITMGVILDRTYAILEWRKYYEGKRSANSSERKSGRL